MPNSRQLNTSKNYIDSMIIKSHIVILMFIGDLTHHDISKTRPVKLEIRHEYSVNDVGI